MELTGQTLLKTAIWLAAFGIFVFQMRNSVHKYLSRPVVQEKSTKELNEIQLPVIYICKDNQFDYANAQRFGYLGQESFYPGQINGTLNISWKGKDRNVSFKDVQRELFGDETSYYQETFYGYDIPAEKIFIAPHGFCIKPHNITSAWISTVKKALFLIVDPYKVNDIQVAEMDNALVSFGPTNESTFDFSMFEIRCTLYDDRIHDERTCTDYEKIGSSYGVCVKQVMRDQLLDSYGCLPPWFESGKQTCEEGSEINVSNETLLQDTIGEIRELVYGKEPKVFAKCLKPCISMGVYMKRVNYKTNVEKNARINFEISKQVTVFKEIYSYDAFSLVVDLGSALGLWLGLSAVGILEFFITFFNFCNKPLF